MNPTNTPTANQPNPAATAHAPRQATPVMDVVPPPSNDLLASMTDNPMATMATPPVAEEPAQPQQPAASTSNAADDLAPEEIEKDQPTEPAPTPAPKPAKIPKPPKQPGSGVGLAITATVIIVLGLAALTVYAYIKTSK